MVVVHGLQGGRLHICIYIYIYTSVDPSIDIDESNVDTTQQSNLSKDWSEQECFVKEFRPRN